MDIKTFVERWEPSGAAEHSNSQSFLNDLCDVLGVERPKPATGNPAKDSYVFEKPVLLANEENASVGHVDLFKEGYFILEAKQGSNIGTKRIGTARRGTAAWNIAMRDAYGQALGYAQTLDDPPPFIITTDIGFCFEFYAAFDGSGNYRAFPNAQTNRVYLKTLLDADAGPKHLDVLRAVFTDPHSLDPSRRATKVTREVAAHLAELARVLEEAGHPPERVARFLMRSIFTMFAEDVGLLPDGLFARLIEEHWLPNPPAFPGGIRSLWKAMNEGGDYFVGKLLQFNGGLFKDADAPPLKAEHLLRLQEAARCDWSEVEPAIFGTLLERALDPHERHRLGAHYTPRAYVERLVRPTIEEPLRAEWDLVRAEVRQLVEGGKEAAAKKAVRAFYDKLTHTRVLDPACGTGNFLYVTLDLFKRLEAEVVALLSELEESQTIGEAAGYGVTPRQFLGIEVKPWAKEIAELVLWIGYLQWHFRTRGRVNPPEPVLRDYGNIELRDAVLGYDREELVRDEHGRPVSRWDGVTFKVSATGESVPDEAARVPVYKYINAKAAKWPKADFIIGNPPFVGNKRMRLALGDGYVEALRQAHDDVPDTSDFVMYWWNNAAKMVATGEVRAAGLITTNSIHQWFNRKVVEKHVRGGKVRLIYAIPDHPWVDAEDGAAVRVAMTTFAITSAPGIIDSVVTEESGPDEAANVTFRRTTGLINPDLTIGPDVKGARPLVANKNLCLQGCKLVGAGFQVEPDERDRLRRTAVRAAEHLPRYVSGSDITTKPHERYVIDLFGMSETEARRELPALFQVVLDRVKPERDQNRRDTRRKNWWLFGENAPKLRRATKDLSRFIATSEVAKHRVFVFFPMPGTLADGSLAVVAHDDAYVLGVLSSRAHVVWSLAAGGRMGVGNDPRYQNGPCFDPFPFPDATPKHVARIRTLAEELDSHRKQRIAQHPSLTITGLYNVLAKTKTGEPLNAKEKQVYEDGLVGVLRQLHDDLDAAVCDAYGWRSDITDEDILAEVVKLNVARSMEERRGLVRWVRPEFQAGEATRRGRQGALIGDDVVEVEVAEDALTAWPKKLHERIAVVRSVLVDGPASWTAVEVATTLKGAKRTEVEEVLQGLAALGLAVSFMAGGVRRWRAAGRLAA